MGRLEGKVALVTGGSMGIGKAICQQFAREGATVAVTDIKVGPGEEVTREIQDTGGKAIFHEMNTAVSAQVKDVFRQVKEELGPVTVLVNNAGIDGVSKPTHELTDEEWQQVIDVNLNGVFYCTREAIPQMKEAGQGSIVNLSSIYGIISAPDIPAYHASKGAVRLMTKTDALLYAQDGIRVNSIHPGFVWTPLVEGFLKKQGIDVQEGRRGLAGLHPIGHVGEPEDIAYGAVYLASGEAKFMTGSELVIDGGYTAR